MSYGPVNYFQRRAASEPVLPLVELAQLAKLAELAELSDAEADAENRGGPPSHTTERPYATDRGGNGSMHRQTP